MLLGRAAVLHNLDLRARHRGFDPGFDLLERFHYRPSVIPSEVEGSRDVIIKLAQRDSSTPLRSPPNDNEAVIFPVPAAEIHPDSPAVPSRACQISAREIRWAAPASRSQPC